MGYCLSQRVSLYGGAWEGGMGGGHGRAGHGRAGHQRELYIAVVSGS